MPELVEFFELAGIPVHWGRWGRTGSRKLREDFLVVLEGSLATLWDALPWGRPVGILSGGAYVPPPHPPRHSLGTAFDLSGLQFEDDRGLWCWELWHKHRAEPKEALAIEAHLRRHHAQVLGPWCNKDHEDHWHIDDREDARGYSERHPSDVRFLQAALHHVWGIDCGGIDGIVGPRTLTAAHTALDQIRVGGLLTSSAVWDAFLAATVLGGLGLVEG